MANDIVSGPARQKWLVKYFADLSGRAIAMFYSQGDEALDFIFTCEVGRLLPDDMPGLIFKNMSQVLGVSVTQSTRDDEIMSSHASNANRLMVYHFGGVGSDLISILLNYGNVHLKLHTHPHHSQKQQRKYGFSLAC